MKKLLVYLLLCIFLICSSTIISAEIVFDKDTIFTKNNINYVFSENVSVQSFDFSPNSISINDVIELRVVPIGGQLDIVFYNLSDNIVIGFMSSVKQDVSFILKINGTKHYLHSNEGNFLDVIPVDVTMTNYTISEYVSNEVIDSYDDFERNNWFSRNIIIFQLPQVSGFFNSKLVRLTNLSLLLIIISFIVVVFAIKRFINGVIVRK